jgi:hypothetical protein
MADIKLELGQEIEFGKVDSVLTVTEGSGKLGELHFSKGSVEWWPSGNSVNCRTYTWGQLADVLSQNGIAMKASKSK